MRHRVVLTGMGAVTAAFAGGAAALEAALSSGIAAGADRRVPEVAIAGLVDDTEARRLSRICRLAVGAARLALRDAGLTGGDGIGLVLGTEHGDFRSTIAFADGYLDAGPAGLSALLFPSTVMNTMAAATTIAVAARQAAVTLNAPAVAGPLAVAHAAASVASGRQAAVLAGGVDEVVDLVDQVLDALQVTEPRGEGAAFLVLEPLESARARGARVLGEVLGTAWRSLPAHPQGVGRSPASRAVARAAAQAGVSVDRLGWVYTSRNGDAERDAWEADVLADALGNDRPRTSLVTAFGQQAAAGPLAVAAAAWTARTGSWPARDGGPPPDVARSRPGLVHALARGGTHVALVVGPPPDETTA
jgi:3-oxoacyl-[acyl-carrier-protein] synthase II